ncbi:hypothetical protein HMPREF1989_02044 [Porphyromonas gingivalis F0566]|nr:hypothetical protein HMPREF1989_02044 [Porphyromonas gingivalis F0566]
MLMESKIVAQAIVKAVIRRKRLLTFDWRYRLLVAFWRMIPVRIWEKTRV